MEFDGRPDGLRPHGVESYLDYYQNQQQEHDKNNPDTARYLLDAEATALLLREGLQYYHRYLSFWHLERYDLCVRDTARNLQLLNFIRNHASSEREVLQFDQWRPYILMMHARSIATPLAQAEDYAAALTAVEAAIGNIEAFLAEYNHTDKADQCTELVYLKRWREELTAQIDEPDREAGPADYLKRLEEELEQAVNEERYEEAASLRDQIRRINGGRLD